MQAVQAYTLLGRRSDRSIIDINHDVTTSVGGVAAWPLVATAAAALSGQLDDCLTGDDLDDAIRRFLVDCDAGLICQDQLEGEIARLLGDLCDRDAGELQGVAAAYWVDDA
jgi:hypothetical protein